jgi:hypothetical protein
MQDQPCHVNILLAQNAYSPRPGSSELRFQLVQNVLDVARVTRSNAPSDVWIVGDGFSSRYAVRGFGFCDLNSPDIYRRAIVSAVVVVVIRSVRMGMMVGILHSAQAILPMGTKPIQRFVEVTLVLPFNVYRSSIPVGDTAHLLTSNHHRVQ